MSDLIPPTSPISHPIYTPEEFVPQGWRDDLAAHKAGTLVGSDWQAKRAASKAFADWVAANV